MKNLQELKAEYAELQQKTREVEAQIYELYKSEFIAKNNGIDIGDTVKFLSDGLECFGVISKMDGAGSMLWSFFLNPMKKDGTLSKLYIRLSDRDNQTLQLVKKA